MRHPRRTGGSSLDIPGRATCRFAAIARTRHIPAPMAGSALKRARKQGVRLDDGAVIPFPYMPRIADLPPGWRHCSTADKIKHLLGMSFDHAPEILSWPLAGLDPLRLSLRMQVWRVVFMIGMKAMLEGKLGRERQSRPCPRKALSRAPHPPAGAHPIALDVMLKGGISSSAPACGSARGPRHRPPYREGLGSRGWWLNSNGIVLV